MRLTFDIAKIRRGILILTSVAILSGTAGAQTPSIKGHFIGESIQHFLSNSPAVSTQLTTCVGEKDQKSAKKHGQDWDFCQQLISAANSNGTVSVPAKCSSPNASLYKEFPPCLDFIGRVEFAEGKLSLMRIFLSAPWSEVYEDLVKEFGPPITAGKDTYQNGYGATTLGSSAAWTNPQFTVLAVEGIGSFRVVDVTMESAAVLARKATENANRPSTIR